jgi:hypothetical protein
MRLASMKQLSLAQENGLINDGCEWLDVETILGRLDKMKYSLATHPNAHPWQTIDPFWYAGAEINQCSDEGMQAFTASLDDGAFPEIRSLDIVFTNLEDATLRQLIGPISRGALPSLLEFCLEGNFASDPFMIEFSNAVAAGALRALRQLSFSLNNIGDDGVKAFAGACAKGALPRLTELQLRQNENLGKPGIQALAVSLSNLALPSLTNLLLSSEWIHHASLKPVCEKRGIRLHDGRG